MGSHQVALEVEHELLRRRHLERVRLRLGSQRHRRIGAPGEMAVEPRQPPVRSHLQDTLARAGDGRTMLLEEDQKHLRALYYAGAYARSAQPSGGLEHSDSSSRSGAARAQVLAWRYRFFEVAGLEC